MKSLAWGIFFLPWSSASFVARVRPPRRYSSSTLILAATRTDFRIETAKTDQDVLNVASFRNNLTNPAMLVAQQQEKKDNIDKPKAALGGLLIGLGVIGPIFGGLSFSAKNNVQEALTTYAIVGGVSGVVTAINNLLGGSVYVMTEAEATNRLLVDYAENLKRKADVGFIALSNDDKYKCVGGIMAVADVQLRNSPHSPQYALKVNGLPSHLHLKNMLVDEDMRRKGVAREMLEAVTMYAKDQTDAELITLVVEDKNEAAVKLYESDGFQPGESQKFMLGRKFMTKKV